MPTSTAFHWNIDPVLIHLGPLGIRWYGLCFVAAFLTGYWIAAWMYRREGRQVAELDSLLTYMLVGTIVGARLGHVLFYDPSYYFAHPLDILKVWEGGLASHGGAAGILIALYLYTRGPGRPRYLWLLDHVAVPTALGGFFIRLGNFFNSEIVGIPTNGWWAVIFDRVDPIPRHPVQLYEAVAYLLIFVVLLLTYARQSARPDGFLLGLFLLLVFSARFVIEFAKTPQAEYEAGFPISVGQILSIPFIIVGLIVVLRSRTRRVAG